MQLGSLAPFPQTQHACKPPRHSMALARCRITRPPALHAPCRCAAPARPPLGLVCVANTAPAARYIQQHQMLLLLRRRRRLAKNLVQPLVAERARRVKQRAVPARHPGSSKQLQQQQQQQQAALGMAVLPCCRRPLHARMRVACALPSCSVDMASSTGPRDSPPGRANRGRING